MRCGFLPALFLSCALIAGACGKKEAESPAAAVRVKSDVVASRAVRDELSGFGSLSFTKKVDVVSVQEAFVPVLRCREGDEVKKGAVLAVMDNPQITLAVNRAGQALRLAVSSTELSRSALLESVFDAEARLANLEKAESELEEQWKIYYEDERKYKAQQTLFLAGGVDEESMRGAKFSLDGELSRIRIAQKEIDIRRIGLRDRDLISAGMTVPENRAARREALITLATARFRAELRGAEARERSARAELESAVVAQRDLTIQSPADGIIAARFVEEGERVKSGDKLFTLIDSGALYASINVREEDAFKIERGMSARVSIDGTKTEYEGSVDMVSPVADASSFSFSVRILLPKEALLNSIVTEGGSFSVSGDKELARPGMFARAVIRTGDDKNILVINNGALIEKKDNEALCFVINNDSAVVQRKLAVREGPEGYYAVESGAREGERVVLYPDAGLREGMYVEVEE